MNEIHDRILAVLPSEGKSLKIKDIAEKSGLNAHTVARNLDVLELMGRVRKIQVGSAKKYFLIDSIPVSGVIDISSDLIVILDNSLKIQYLNKKAHQILQIETSSVIGEKLEFLNLDLFSSPEIIEGLKRFTGEKVYRQDILYERNYQKFWYAVSIIGLSLKVNQYLIGIIAEDITERKAIEEALFESREKSRLLADLLEHSSQPFVVCHPDGNLIIWNKAYETLLGYSSEELRPLNVISDITPVKWHQLQIRVGKQVLTTGRPVRYEKEYLRKDGSTVPVEMLVHVDSIQEGTTPCFFGFVTDISERIKTEEFIRTSEAKYRTLFEDAPIPISENDFSEVKTFFDQIKKTGVTDFRTYFEDNPLDVRLCIRHLRNVRINQASLMMVGAYTREDLLANLPKIFTEESIRVIKELLIAFAHGETTFQSEIPLKSKAGDTLYFILQVSVLAGCEKDLSRVFFSYLDITNRKITEKALIEKTEALKRSEQRFQLFAENSPDIIYRMSFPDGKFEYISSACFPITGYTPEEYYQDPLLFSRIIHPTWKKNYQDHWEKIIHGEVFNDYQVAIIHASGDTRWLHIKISATPDEDGRIIGLEGSTRDITDTYHVKFMI